MRVKVTLACTECKQRNYNTMKNKKNDPDRIELKNIADSARKRLFTKKQNKERRSWQIKPGKLPLKKSRRCQGIFQRASKA